MQTQNPIMSLFGRSPIGPLQEHMKTVEACAAEVIPLFEALVDLDRDRILAAKEKIFELEHRADHIKNEIRSHLPKSLFMPIDRRDFLDMLNAQDSIADTAQDIAGLLVLRRMTIPEPFQDHLTSYVRRTVDAVRQCGKVVNELDELVAFSFGGRPTERVLAMIDEINRVEDETDGMGMDLTRILFDHEDEMKPISVVIWYQLLQEIGDLADYAEDVGDRLRLLIAR